MLFFTLLVRMSGLVVMIDLLDILSKDVEPVLMLGLGPVLLAVLDLELGEQDLVGGVLGDSGDDRDQAGAHQ